MPTPKTKRAKTSPSDSTPATAPPAARKTSARKASARKAPARKAPARRPAARTSAAAPAKPSARAADWIKRPRSVTAEDVKRVVDTGAAKADTLIESVFTHVTRLAKQAKAIYEMVQAWWKGDYDFPWASVAAMTAALLYFIGPFDFIPDFLPLVGFLDDATIMGFVVRRVQGDLKRYAASKGRALRDVGLDD